MDNQTRHTIRKRRRRWRSAGAVQNDNGGSWHDMSTTMKPARRFLKGLLACWFLTTAVVWAQTIPVSENLWRLVAQEDTDGDQKITVHDRITPFAIHDQNGAAVPAVTNVYPLSVLLQELKRAEDFHHGEAALNHLRLDESVVDRTHRLIKDFYWDALTRRIDADHVDRVVPDPKVVSKCDTIYVPGADKAAVKYFQAVEKTAAEQNRSPALKVIVLPTPDKITGTFVRNLDGAHGLLSLALAAAFPDFYHPCGLRIRGGGQQLAGVRAENRHDRIPGRVVVTENVRLVNPVASPPRTGRRLWIRS